MGMMVYSSDDESSIKWIGFFHLQQRMVAELGRNNKNEDKFVFMEADYFLDYD